MRFRLDRAFVGMDLPRDERVTANESEVLRGQLQRVMTRSLTAAAQEQTLRIAPSQEPLSTR